MDRLRAFGFVASADELGFPKLSHQRLAVFGDLIVFIVGKRPSPKALSNGAYVVHPVSKTAFDLYTSSFNEPSDSTWTTKDYQTNRFNAMSPERFIFAAMNIMLAFVAWTLLLAVLQDTDHNLLGGEHSCLGCLPRLIDLTFSNKSHSRPE